MTTAGAGASAIGSGIQFGVSHGDGSLGAVATRTQDAISALLKAQVQVSAGWTGASGSLFSGLDPDGKTPFTVLILKKILAALANAVNDLSGLSHEAISTINGVLQDAEADAAAVLHGIEVLSGGIFGWVSSLRFTVVPIGTLSDGTPNLLTASTFADGSIGSNPDWTIDLSTSRTDDETGALKVVADGRQHAVRSGSSPIDAIPVTGGQQFTETIYVRHQGYIGSGLGPAVMLQVVPYTAAGTGTPVTLDTFTPDSPDLDWPGHEMSGSYTVPDDVVGVQTRVLVTADAWAGTVWADDATDQQTALMQQSWTEGLVDDLQAGISQLQLLIDTFFNAITGAAQSLNTLEDLADALLAIPARNIAGILGPINIGDTITNFLDHLVGGFVGVLDGNASLADLFNIGKQVSSQSSQGANAWQILGIRDNTSTSSGFLPSGRANFDLTAAAFSPTAPTIAVTQGASAICFDRVTVSQPLGVISWLGYGLADITAFYINVWKWNAATTAWDLAHHSANIIGDITDALGATSPKYLFYNLDAPLAQVATEHYLYEYVPVGTGTHHMVGETTGSWLPAHPTAPVSKYGFTRDNTSAPDAPPSSVAKADMTSADTVPWTEVAVNNGSSGADSYDPLTIYFTEDGTIPVPSWADFIDAVPLGTGGGAHQGGTAGIHGDGGEPGKFAGVTWARGTDYTTGAIVTFAGGTPGVGGGVLVGHSAGTNGGDSTLSLDDDHIVTGLGGAGATTVKFGGPTLGRGPGTYTYNGMDCVGGGDQNNFGADGASPGGGGGGGNWLTFSKGGNGGGPAGWVRFRQADIDGAVSGDTSPPTPPTSLVVDSATFSTLSVTASGAVDA